MRTFNWTIKWRSMPPPSSWGAHGKYFSLGASPVCLPPEIQHFFYFHPPMETKIFIVKARKSIVTLIPVLLVMLAAIFKQDTTRVMEVFGVIEETQQECHNRTCNTETFQKKCHQRESGLALNIVFNSLVVNRFGAFLKKKRISVGNVRATKHAW